MTNAEIKAAIDSAITNKTAADSITPAILGAQLKAIVDYADGSVTPPPPSTGDFFLDNFTGAAGAYSGHTPDTGTATADAGITINGSGKLIMPASGFGTISITSTSPTNRRITAVIDTIPVGAGAIIRLLEGAGGVVLQCAFNVTNAGIDHFISTDAGVQASTSNLQATFPITFVAERNGGTITTTINGTDPLTASATANTTNVSRLITSNGGTIDSLRGQNI